MPNEQTKQLTFGAMMIALFSILLAVSFYVPVLNLITSFFIALPIAWYSAKFERKASIFVTIISIGMSFFIGGLLAVPLGMIHAPLGFVIGDAIRTKKSKLFLLMSTGLTLLISMMIQYVIAVITFEFNPVKELITMATEFYNQMGAAMETFNSLPKDYYKQVSDAIFLLEIVIPSLVIVAIFIISWMFINILLPVLKKLGLVVPKYPAYRNMRLPKSVLWYYLIVQVVTLFIDLDQGTFAFMVFVNAAFILRFLLFLQGISLIHFFIHKKGWPKWATILASILAFVLQPYTVLLGIIDLGFNIRAFLKDKTKK
ncbi:YybS family protein [Paenisporosarcina indica]|uniref:YybS family protein n=1 Tax=Paenisporosarcina indica TaxID=650093 RepID=UPI00094FE85A|nr:DUF2232 domain-containing protein [Paenisporosarcina indica]